MTYRERWVEFRQDPYLALAWWLPRRLVYWALIRAFSEASVRIAHKSAGELTIMEVADVWQGGTLPQSYPEQQTIRRTPPEAAQELRTTQAINE